MDWNTVSTEQTSSRRDAAKTQAIIDGALQRRDLSATAIAAALRSNGVDVKDSYVTTVVNIARATFDHLIGVSAVKHNGKTYALSVVESKPELVKRTA